MADVAFTVKVDGRPFVLDRITLGDWRMFKTEFGLNASNIASSVTNDKGEAVEVLNLDDPNVLIALLVASLRHERPLAPLSSLVDEVEALGLDGLDFSSDEDEEEVPPTQDDASEATEGRKKSGSSGKRPKSSGRQSGAKS